MCVPVYAHRAATVHLAKVYRHDFETQTRTRQASVGHGDVLMYVLCTRPRSGLTDRTQPVRLVRLHTYVCISPHSPDRSPHVHTHINTHTHVFMHILIGPDDDELPKLLLTSPGDDEFPELLLTGPGDDELFDTDLVNQWSRIVPAQPDTLESEPWQLSRDIRGEPRPVQGPPPPQGSVGHPQVRHERIQSFLGCLATV